MPIIPQINWGIRTRLFQVQLIPNLSRYIDSYWSFHRRPVRKKKGFGCIGVRRICRNELVFHEI